MCVEVGGEECLSRGGEKMVVSGGGVWVGVVMMVVGWGKGEGP
jgi:hypothetical protein